MVTMKLILERVLAGEKLQRDETKDILLGITRDEYPSEQISALLQLFRCVALQLTSC